MKCGELQSPELLLMCCKLDEYCTLEDLFLDNDKAMKTSIFLMSNAI